MCGGTNTHVDMGYFSEGLSPRVRGNPNSSPAALPPARSIPACAGEPIDHRLPASSIRVYPRVCGGTPTQRHRQRYWHGLSPRVRGNPPRKERISVLPGSIPACAGEPPESPALTASGQVYPRVCGGTLTHCWSASPPTGLSPRVRGNRLAALDAGLLAGSIPACAGEPNELAAATGMPTVYPRVCGGTRLTAYG